MTCQELHSYFADPLRVDADLSANCAEVAEHIVACADCNPFVEAQRELGTSLRLARESAPRLSASLDAAVLANYRGHIAARESSVTPARRRRPLAVLRWSTAVAAAMLLTAIVFFSSRKTVTTEAPPRTAHPAGVPQPPESNHATVTAQRPSRTKPDGVLARRKRPASSPTNVGSSLPEGFRGLMYCDELSCVGAMEMIRVQLPSSRVAGLTPASTLPNGVIFADVLVGPDGIARSIRIEE